MDEVQKNCQKLSKTVICSKFLLKISNKFLGPKMK